MPRAGWVKPVSGDRLPDRVGVGVLTRVFPPGLVDEVLLETGRVERRRRSLPARLVLYFVVGMGLFSDASYEEVLRQLTEGLAWSGVGGDGSPWVVPTKAAIFRARSRLGVEPLRALFEGACAPMAGGSTQGAFYRGLRVLSVDGTCLDVADTPANAAAFGRPGPHRRVGGGAFPQVRLVGVCEVGTHAIVDAALGSYATSERVLAERLLPRLPAGSLCLADRGFYGFERFRMASEAGAQLVWRVSRRVHLPSERVLPDGSYLSTLRPAQRGARAAQGLRVRVIEYLLEPRVVDADALEQGDSDTSVYRLVSTLLDPDAAPAHELATLYRERWEIETALDELKTHQRGPQVVLRSKTPDGVMQEAYGLLLTHYAIRRLMHDAALAADLDPDRISFLQSLRAARRSARASTGFSPHGPS
ncbi:MAG: IS4 family transposase [Trueperaceae bacterium]|nr:IS4 family transposase [Trueperaceae bacterium]